SNGRQPSAPQAVVRMEAAGQKCTIEHLNLSRDIYYLNDGGSTHFWGSPVNQGEPVRLGPDEYFVMGDNSEVSLDARFWQQPVVLPHEGDLNVQAGRVPGRFMLGKAFFVYWPAGYRPGNLQYGIIPDFGDMRFIH